MLLLLALLLALQARPPLEPPRSLAPEVVSPEVLVEELLSRIKELRRAAKQAAGDLWPGWDPTATPMGVHKAKEFSVLIGHPKPPAPFRPYATTQVSVPVFVADTTEGIPLANTAQPFAGALTSFVGFSDLMDKNPVEEAVALGIHELFHAHQRRIAPQKYANVLVVLWGQYPEFSARNRALLELEAEALLRALRAPDAEEQRRQAGDFQGLRAARRKEMAADVARYESAEESSEGLARYMEYRLLEVAYPARVELREKRLQALENLGSLERDRERFYVLGMAEAALLDRLRPGWKKEFESSDALLDDLLARAVPPATAVRDVSSLVREQEQVLAKREDEGSRRLGVLLTKGRRVVVEVGQAKQEVRLRGFNPNGSLQLTPNHVVHTYLLLDLKGMKMEFTGVPAVYDKLQDAFWFVLPDEVVQQAIERFANHPEKLVIKGTGFLGEFENVEVEQRGREVRVRPAAVLQRKPPPPKPEFVKPN